MVTIC